MDGRAMAVNQRRRLIAEAAELERERETALLEQLEERFAELEGPALDEEILPRMAPAEADIVRAVLHGDVADETSPEADPDEAWLSVADGDPELEEGLDDDHVSDLLAEIARLQEEIALSRRRRDAYARYDEILDR